MRKFSKMFAAVLIVCGIAPLFHHKPEFTGLPMALAGMLGLLVRDKNESAIKANKKNVDG